MAEERYYDSDYEFPVFIPECPSLMHLSAPLHPCANWLYEHEVHERAADNESRIKVGEIIFPEAPGVVWRHEMA